MKKSKFETSVRNANVYVSYVRSREQYHSNLIMLSAIVDDPRLDVKVKVSQVAVCRCDRSPSAGEYDRHSRFSHRFQVSETTTQTSARGGTKR